MFHTDVCGTKAEVLDVKWHFGKKSSPLSLCTPLCVKQGSALSSSFLIRATLERLVFTPSLLEMPRFVCWCHVKSGECKYTQTGHACSEEGAVLVNEKSAVCFN